MVGLVGSVCPGLSIAAAGGPLANGRSNGLALKNGLTMGISFDLGCPVDRWNNEGLVKSRSPTVDPLLR
jgi:hypothetical protein